MATNILDKTVAQIHKVKLEHLNQLINNNLKRFGIKDLINLIGKNSDIVPKDFKIKTSNSQKFAYLLFQRGVYKMNNNLKQRLNIVGIIPNIDIKKATKEIPQTELLNKVMELLEDKSLNEISEILLHAKQIFDTREFTKNKSNKFVDRKLYK